MEGSLPDVESRAQSKNQLSLHTRGRHFSEYSENEECSEDVTPLTGTDMLVWDYIEFKAARHIQCMVRGWLIRNRIAKQTRAAIIIQTEWRRFYCKRLYLRKLEKLTQQRIEEHYFRSAQIIQAAYRGWWSRQNIHDHTRLIRLSNWAGEDLLHCVAFKLHHLLRTFVIPGVYSLKNTTTLSKVEELLANLRFKQCNDHSQEINRQRNLRTHLAKKDFIKTEFATKIPYSGLDMYTTCSRKCQTISSEKDADRKMAKILRMYQLAHHEDPRIIKMRHGKAQVICLPPPTSFCADLVRSMKRWNIIKESEVTVERDIFKKPGNIENFLKEIHWKWDNLHGNCHCNDAFIKVLEKGDKLTGSFPPLL
uniref:Uncharacterized protein n=1 Tax=Glossina brevipalpis TaxID=37001 RepID=A0A1A9WW80_9MUSC